MAEIKPNVKLAPLYEDLTKIVGKEFFVSTAFKRWLVKVGLAEIWNQCNKLVSGYRGVIAHGDINEFYACSTLTLLLNNFYDAANHKSLVNMVKGILKTFSEEKKVTLNVGHIKEDLTVAGIDESLLRSISEDVTCAKIGENDDKMSGLSEEEKVRSLEKAYKTALSKDVSSNMAIEAYHEWHSAAVIYLGKYFSNADADFIRFKNIDNTGNGYTLEHNFDGLYSIYNYMMSQVHNVGKNQMEIKRSPMVFISHSSKDKAFVEALVELLESIGFDESNLFCSSIDGYGIGLGEDVFDTLKRLFLEHELYVLFVHSPRYYNSTVSMNEMGAAWVLRANYYSLLTKDMNYNEMSGVVNSNSIAIKVDSDDAKARLTELKDKLCSVFSFKDISGTKWERKRDKFLEAVTSIDVSSNKTNSSNSVDEEYKRLQIEKMKKEADEQKKAIIRSEIINRIAGSRILKISNTGKSVAKNLKIEWLNTDDNIMILPDLGEIGDLTPNNVRLFKMVLAIGHSETMDLRYTWSDEYSEKNQYDESIQVF